MKRTIATTLIALMLTAPTAYALTKADVHTTLDNAVKAIDTMGLDDAIPYTKDPSNGMIELDTAGLHTFAINGSGEIVFDHSDQTEPGMNVATLPFLDDGTPALAAIVQLSSTPTQGVAVNFPHPKSAEVGNAYLACQEVADIFVCSMAWGM